MSEKQHAQAAYWSSLGFKPHNPLILPDDQLLTLRIELLKNLGDYEVRTDVAFDERGQIREGFLALYLRKHDGAVV